MRETTLDSKGVLANNTQNPANNLLFLASNMKIGLGYSFPKIITEKFGKLFISDNNFDKNSLLKINATNVFSIDKYNQFIKADIDYEHRIGNSNFSSNTSLTGTLNRFSFFSHKGFIDTTLFSGSSDYKVPVWIVNKTNNIYTQIQFSEQLRYYINKAKEMRRGRSGKNLNGFYLGLMATYSNTTFNQKITNNTERVLFTKLRVGQYFGAGAIFGFQNQFKNKLFFDWGVSFLVNNRNAQFYYLTTTYGRNFSINPYLKIGFVK